jgi:hypothetical protein
MPLMLTDAPGEPIVLKSGAWCVAVDPIALIGVTYRSELIESLNPWPKPGLRLLRSKLYASD